MSPVTGSPLPPATRDPGWLVLQDGPIYRHFASPLEVVTAHAPEEVQEALRRIDAAVSRRGLYAAGLITYEAAVAFDLAAHPALVPGPPLLWFGLYEAPQVWKVLPPAGKPYELAGWRSSLDERAYAAAIAAIKEHIARGDTYQVNYTLQMLSRFAGDSWTFYGDLARAQSGNYSAYLDLGRYAVCSASPELFFRRVGDLITTRPMKGTTHRGLSAAEDEQQIASLRASAKDRAENVMIVDMLRNDLGRVARTGSVQVPELFAVERYPTLLQMTSTVTARSDATLFDLLAALFPCASITGAPKVRTMEIIRELEAEPRGLYTGAIGYAGPHGEACFNVAIRTVVIDRENGEARYGVGSGIVWDSDAAAEYAECRLKAQVLLYRRPPFALLETMLWTPELGYFLLHKHMERLAASARYFGFAFDESRARRQLAEQAQACTGPCRVRLLLDQGGAITVESISLTGAAGPGPLTVGLATAPVPADHLWLHHKTTHRQVYERARVSRPDVDQVLLWNERGEVTEAYSSNVVVDLDGRLVTPPLSSGLLAGTFRGHLLEQGTIVEQVVKVADLQRCRSIFLINSVRGWQRATLAKNWGG